MGFDEIYRAAVKADEDFQVALVEEYGAKEAAEARYRPLKSHPEAIQRLARAKRAADEALHVATLKRRQSEEDCEMCGRNPAESVDGGMRGERFLCVQCFDRARAIGEAF